jgi:hypothetical protein
MEPLADVGAPGRDGIQRRQKDGQRETAR